MGEFGPWHLVIIALVFVVLFGARKLPGAAKSVGQSLKILKEETKGLRGDDDTVKVPVATAAIAQPVAAPVAPAAQAPAQPAAAPTVAAPTAEASVGQVATAPAYSTAGQLGAMPAPLVAAPQTAAPVLNGQQAG